MHFQLNPNMILNNINGEIEGVETFGTGADRSTIHQVNKNKLPEDITSPSD
jgi:hypothetical protein